MATKKTDKQKLDFTGMEKEEALNTALKYIDKQFGAGSVMRLGSDAHLDIKPIPTGALNLDVALGIGGLPRGRVVEIYGPESSGKTTLALHVVAEVQKRGGIAAFIDAEHALDPAYAANLGVKTTELLISQPDTGEQALEITEALVRSGALDIIVIDSVAALVPKAEIDGLMGDNHVGVQARLMSQALRKLTGLLMKTNTTLIFINQLREKVGVMYGSPEVTTGGKALKFYSSVRIDIRRTEAIKKGNDFVGNHVRVKVVKNKVAPPFKQVEFDIMYGHGISSEGIIITLATECGVLTRSGAWYSYNGQRLANGLDNTREYFLAHRDVLDEIEAKVREFYELPTEAEMRFDDKVITPIMDSGSDDDDDSMPESGSQEGEYEDDFIEIDN